MYKNWIERMICLYIILTCHQILFNKLINHAILIVEARDKGDMIHPMWFNN